MVNSAHPQSGSLNRLMIEIEQLGRPCVLCSKIVFEEHEVETLLSLPLVVSIILESESPQLMSTFPGRLGCFNKDGADIQLPTKIAADLIYIGRWSEFGTRAAWHVWRAGVRFICTAKRFRRQAFVVALDKTLRSLIYHFQVSPVGKKMAQYIPDGLQIQKFLYSYRLRKIKRLPTPIKGSRSDWQSGRIVIVGGSLGPGGAERQLTTTLLGLRARGYERIHFIHDASMRAPNDFFLPLVIEAGISYSQVDQIGGSNPAVSEIEADLEERLEPLGDLGKEVIAYAKEFYTRRPEIVHVWLDHMNVVAGLAALLIGVPRIVLSCRSLSPVHFAFNQPYMRPVYRFLANFPNVVLLNNSAAGASDYRQWLALGASREIPVVKNGFDFSTFPSFQDRSCFRNEYRHRLRIPDDVPVIGVIMRISEEKRPLLWLEIARQVSQRMPHAHFLVVGNGPMCEQIKMLADQVGLVGKVHFPGHEKNAMMALAAMDLFLLTSRVEGLPNVLIEAQALGVPPIAVDVGGAKETMLVGETGWLMNTDNPQIIASQILEIFSQPEKIARASAKGKLFVNQEFCAKKMIAETLAVYGLE